MVFSVTATSLLNVLFRLVDYRCYVVWQSVRIILIPCMMWCGVVGNFLIIANLFTLDLIRILSYRYRFLVHPVSESGDGICSIHSSLGQIILRHFTLDELAIDPLVGILPDRDR
jgi:hypothetical protein